jgi:integrase
MSSKTRAREVEDKRKQELRDGAAGIRKREGPKLFSTAAEEFCERKAQTWSPSMRRSAQTSLAHLLPTFGRKLLCDIAASDIGKYQTGRLAEGASNRTANIEVGLLRGVLRRAGVWGRIAMDVSQLKERDDVGRALSDTEEQSLLAECAASRSRVLYPLVLTLLESGVRYNGIRCLRWADIDLDNGSAKIGRDKTAAGSGRVVPLSGRAIEALRFWSQKFPDRTAEHFAFPREKYGTAGAEGIFGFQSAIVLASTPSEPVGSVKTAWECARKRAGLPHFRIHDLRHTRASRLIAAGVPLPVIAKLLGWSAGTMARMAFKYGHYNLEQMRAAMESVNRPVSVPASAAQPGVEIGKIQ